MEVPDWQGGNLFLGVALQVATLLHQIITTFSIFLVKKVLLYVHTFTLILIGLEFPTFFVVFATRWSMTSKIVFLANIWGEVKHSFPLLPNFFFLRVFKITSFVKTKNCEIRFFTEIDLALLSLTHSLRRETNSLTQQITIFLSTFWIFGRVI